MTAKPDDNNHNDTKQAATLTKARHTFGVINKLKYPGIINIIKFKLIISTPVYCNCIQYMILFLRVQCTRYPYGYMILYPGTRPQYGTSTIMIYIYFFPSFSLLIFVASSCTPSPSPPFTERRALRTSWHEQRSGHVGQTARQTPTFPQTHLGSPGSQEFDPHSMPNDVPCSY